MHIEKRRDGESLHSWFERGAARYGVSAHQVLRRSALLGKYHCDFLDAQAMTADAALSGQSSKVMPRSGNMFAGSEPR
jgi:hypothetical protein